MNGSRRTSVEREKIAAIAASRHLFLSAAGPETEGPQEELEPIATPNANPGSGTGRGSARPQREEAEEQRHVGSPHIADDRDPGKEAP